MECSLAIANATQDKFNNIGRRVLGVIFTVMHYAPTKMKSVMVLLVFFGGLLIVFTLLGVYRLLVLLLWSFL